MSLTPAAAGTLRRALATAVVVPVTPYQADGTPDWDAYATLTRRLVPGRRPSAQPPLPENIKTEISGILIAWGMR